MRKPPFKRRSSLSPEFGGAWEGVAYTKFFRGDWAGGQAAVAKALQSGHPLPDRRPRRALRVREARGREDRRGLQEIDSMAKSPDAPVIDGVASVDRAGVLAEAAVIEMPSPKRRRPTGGRWRTASAGSGA